METDGRCILLINTETMQTNNIMNADMLDILFEHKNKAYGAYNLRRTYDKRLYAAMGVTLGVGLLFTITTLFAGGGEKKIQLEVSPPIILTELEEHKKKEEPKMKVPETAAPRAAATAQIEQIRVQQHVIPDIVPDEQVPEDKKVATLDELDKAQIGAISSLGADDPGNKAPVISGTGTGGKAGEHLGKGGNEVVDEKGFVNVQVEARFPGGLEAWKKFLERNLNQDLPVENAAPVGRYTVIVAFTVDKEGNVSDVKAQNNPGYGTADEAVRVIKRGPKWQPAIQNGRNVTYRQHQSITFEVSES